MLDCVVRNEKEPDVVQISGGEPTLHPDFFRVLEMCKERPIRHLMVNTNGIRIAQDEEFAKRLAGFMPEFELYLQFDSLQRETVMRLRGADLRVTRPRLAVIDTAKNEVTQWIALPGIGYGAASGTRRDRTAERRPSRARSRTTRHRRHG